jgi:hypothetical protein
LEQWVTTQVPVAETPPVQAALAAVRRVVTQDLEPDPTTGQRSLRRVVAVERMPSLGDPEMRHGRKTRTRLFTGYKRHVITLVDADVIVGAMVRPANEPEHEALAVLTPDLAPHGRLAELLIDRGSLGSADIGALHARGVAIRATVWTSTNRGRFPTSAFVIQLAEARVTCPAQQTVPMAPGATTAHFAAAVCQPCARRAAGARGGRSIAIHPQEDLLQSLRAHQQQPEGRTRLRQRTTIEHSLARVAHLQGPKARDTGIRTNTLDVRRVAVVANLQWIARLPRTA